MATSKFDMQAISFDFYPISRVGNCVKVLFPQWPRWPWYGPYNGHKIDTELMVTYCNTEDVSDFIISGQKWVIVYILSDSWKP